MTKINLENTSLYFSFRHKSLKHFLLLLFFIRNMKLFIFELLWLLNFILEAKCTNLIN